jgi:hypothetical protein
MVPAPRTATFSIRFSIGEASPNNQQHNDCGHGKQRRPACKSWREIIPRGPEDTNDDKSSDAWKQRSKNKESREDLTVDSTWHHPALPKSA